MGTHRMSQDLNTTVTCGGGRVPSAAAARAARAVRGDRDGMRSVTYSRARPGETGVGRLNGWGVREAEGCADPVWVLSDAVVLATARLSGTHDAPASLPELIANADAVFHFIPTADEIEGALSRLLGAGLVTVGNLGIAVEPFGRELLARARGGRDGDPMIRVQHLLALMEHIPTEPVPWYLDREVYEAVAVEYRHKLWQTYRA